MEELLLRAAALMLSFLGLCEAVRTLLDVNRFLAPSVAAGGIIVVLMIAGMADGLLCGVWLLYGAGWAYWVYNLLIGRRRPDWLVALLCIAIAAVLTWMLWPAKMVHPDDFSHWGLAVESLLRRDAFPDAAERVITYQSYPMGATVFIYYVARLLGGQEGLRFIAQNFLCAVLLLSVFALAEDGKGWLWLAAAAMYALLYKFNRTFEVLQVDWLQSYFGVAIGAAALYYRRDLRKAVLVALPCLIAVAVTKNSGLFFSVVGAAMLVLAAERGQYTKRQLGMAVALAIGLPVAMYLLWTLHVKLSFANGLESKHAVSVSTYARIAGEKSLRTILRIGWRMIRWWFRLTYESVLTVGFAAGSVALICWLRKTMDPVDARWLVRWMLGCFAVFALWHAMLFVMYVVSMPLEEAQKIASYSRYTTAGLIFPMGMAMAAQLEFLNRGNCRENKKAVLAWTGLIVLCIVAPLMIEENGAWWKDQWRADGSYFPTRSEVLWARERYDLPEDGRYLVLADGRREVDMRGVGYRAKYDLYSADVIFAMLLEDGSMEVYTATEWWNVEDASEWLKSRKEDFDTAILLSENEDCKRLMEECAGEFQVIQVTGKRIEDL